jgi:hypothetical protein
MNRTSRSTEGAHNKAASVQARKSIAATRSPEETVQDHLEYLAPGVTKGPLPLWPPDAFALCATILQRSGAYCSIIDTWPPKNKGTDWQRTWSDEAERLGHQWRQAWIARNELELPQELKIDWELICQGHTPVSKMAHHNRLCTALLRILAAADEASAGVGIPYSNSPIRSDQDKHGYDPFLQFADELLLPDKPGGSTLCQLIGASKIRVLPKMHTPQSGLTIRSFSNNLALSTSSEIRAEWWTCYGVEIQQRFLNLLLVPWPEVVRPSRFRATREPVVSTASGLGGFGLFTLDPEGKEKDVSRPILNLIRDAERRVGKVDGIILPEMALSTRQHKLLSPQIVGRSQFLVAGVGSTARGEDRPGSNYVCFDIPFLDSEVNLRQSKHHRWRLDRPQVLQYGLGTNLHPETYWWEHIALGDRKLIFVAMRPWLTISVMICEDLARPDPVGDLVRAVGPNLVIALLMDGPQLAGRWSARYATTLADDPGCSVLTLTSAGMSRLSRPKSGASQSDVVALWKDAQSGSAIEIPLTRESRGIVLNITSDYEEEWTADGRSDKKTTGYAILAGIHSI